MRLKCCVVAMQSSAGLTVVREIPAVAVAALARSLKEEEGSSHDEESFMEEVHGGHINPSCLQYKIHASRRKRAFACKRRGDLHHDEPSSKVQGASD